MSNTLRKEENELLKQQHGQLPKIERKDMRRKNRVRKDRNEKESTVSFLPFFKTNNIDPISNSSPTPQFPLIGKMINFSKNSTKSSSSTLDEISGKHNEKESLNEILSCENNDKNDKNEKSRSTSYGPCVPNFSQSSYSLTSTTDSEHSSGPSSPKLTERKQRLPTKNRLPSIHRENYTNYSNSNNTTNSNNSYNSHKSDDYLHLNSKHFIDHSEIQIILRNIDYEKELNKREKVNAFIARQEAFEKNEKDETIRKSHERRKGVNSRSIEIAMENLNLECNCDNTYVRKSRENNQRRDGNNNYYDSNNYHNIDVGSQREYLWK